MIQMKIRFTRRAKMIGATALALAAVGVGMITAPINWNGVDHRSWHDTMISQGYEQVTEDLADALAEGEGDHPWDQCMVKIGDTSRIACPDGYSITS